MRIICPAFTHVPEPRLSIEKKNKVK